MYTGDQAGAQYTGSPVGTQLYDPQGDDRLQPAARRASTPVGACALRGSGDGINDVLQYWFGGYLQIPGDGLDDGRRGLRRRPGSTTRSAGSTGA